MANKPVLLWFRRDLRIEDNPALESAVSLGEPVIPIFIWAPHEEGKWEPGAASRWWLHQSLKDLSIRLSKLGSRLILRSGNSLDVLDTIIKETGAATVYWNRLYEPHIVKRDTSIKKHLKANQITVESYNSHLLIEPWKVATQQGTPFQVFTPFWKACRSQNEISTPQPAPKKIRSPNDWPSSDDLDSFDLEPKIDWAQGIRDTWRPGELSAHSILDQFIDKRLLSYETERDLPGRVGSSRLSPHLHFGEISPRRVWHDVTSADHKREPTKAKSAGDTFLSEIGWREFAHHLLYHFPDTTDEPLRKQFAEFPWRQDSQLLRAWQKGQTGYPMVDAGMRELWTTGWMHNRVRMIVASFLVKHLLLPWQDGANWFWDTLVDADLANNTLGWQWSAGCGADAAPYFRIFNPMRQGERFDPDGAYVKKWCPELRQLPAKWIHEPWRASTQVLSEAGIELGGNYPNRLVDHSDARTRALEAYESIK